MTDHPDLEALSASLDGEELSTLEAAHLETCAVCRDRRAELRAVQLALGVPPEPGAAPDVRDRAIAQAVEMADEWLGADREADAEAAPTPPPAAAWPPAGRERPGRVKRAGTQMRWWLTGSAAAAVLLLVVLTAGLLSSGSRGGDEDTALSAGPAGGRATQQESSPPPVVPEGVTDGGDLGDVSDMATLRGRVGPAVSRNAAPMAGSAGPAGPAEAATDAAAPTPRIVGTRVCEVEARTVRPQVGVVVYAATVRYRGTAAVVLGFADQVGTPPVTLLVLAPGESCRLLAESTTP